MIVLRRFVAAVAVCGVALTAPSAQGEERVVAVERAYTEVVVFRGVVAWSSYRPGAGYRLALSADGRVTHPQIAHRDEPFDVDLGPDSRGRTVAVYSRCRTGEAGAGGSRGCHLFEYDIHARRERPLAFTTSKGYSEAWPAIWGRRVAFARHRDESSPAVAVLDRLQVRSTGGHQWSVRGGTPAGPTIADPDGRARRLDLVGRRLVFAWSFTTDRCDAAGDDREIDGVGAEVWDIRLGGARRRVDRGCTETGPAVFGPSLTPSRLLYNVAEDGQHYAALEGPAGSPSPVQLTPADGALYVTRYGGTTASVREASGTFTISITP